MNRFNGALSTAGVTLVVLLVGGLTACSAENAGSVTPAPGLTSRSPTALPATTPTPTVDPRAAAQQLVIPSGTCKSGSGAGWEQPEAIELGRGRGESFDLAGVGAGITATEYVGSADMNGDGADDLVILVNCTGTPQELCCAGRTSSLNFVVVLDVSGRDPERIGHSIAASPADLPDGDGSRNIKSARLDGTRILTTEVLVYPEGLSPADVSANEGTVTYTWSNGDWVRS